MIFVSSETKQKVILSQDQDKMGQTKKCSPIYLRFRDQCRRPLKVRISLFQFVLHYTRHHSENPLTLDGASKPKVKILNFKLNFARCGHFVALHFVLTTFRTHHSRTTGDRRHIVCSREKIKSLLSPMAFGVRFVNKLSR